MSLFRLMNMTEKGPENERGRGKKGHVKMGAMVRLHQREIAAPFTVAIQVREC